MKLVKKCNTCDCRACTNRDASVPHPNATKQFSPDCWSHLVSGTIDLLDSLVIPYLKFKKKIFCNIVCKHLCYNKIGEMIKYK